MTSYDVQGFLTTATVGEGISTGFDERGFPTTLYPANCPTSNFPMKAGEILQASTIVRGEQESSAESEVSSSSGPVVLPTESGPGIATGVTPPQSGGIRQVSQQPVSLAACVLALVFLIFA